ncbi:hypothetical protein Taro_054041 [Colocasia esculenta]|uniref:Uncharacterized protein n=1 Tax=Colocasia esculenta TaxID=4460 RepID=A0A843XPI6_COLES|nr:hypothetical protein [Colocasia esculenta]
MQVLQVLTFFNPVEAIFSLIGPSRLIKTHQGTTGMALAPRVLGFSQLAAEHASATKPPRVPATVSEHRPKLLEQNLFLPSRSGDSCSSTAQSPRPTTSRSPRVISRYPPTCLV